MTPRTHFRACLALLAALALCAAVSPQSTSRPPGSAAPAPQKAGAPPPAGNPNLAQKAADSAQKAASAGNWLEAYDDFSQAVAFAPANNEFRAAREAVRFRLVQQRLDTAERLALSGQLPDAETQIRRALLFDPANSVARERLAQIVSLDQSQDSPQPPQIPGAVQLRAQPGRHSFDFHGDIRAAYQEVARQFGVTADFDPDFQSRQVRFRVNDVDFQTAMTVLGDISNTFWVPLDPRTFVAAEDTPEKRQALAPEILKTFVFPASVEQSDMTEAVRALREVGGLTKTALNPATRELTIRDTPEKVALAGRVLQQIE
ncbi:MAG: hypothetical protein ACRD5L_07760, partial [Bryobacteraceae bacterium]